MSASVAGFRIAQGLDSAGLGLGSCRLRGGPRCQFMEIYIFKNRAYAGVEFRYSLELWFCRNSHLKDRSCFSSF